jgi:7-cyano-7-deazaguanine synthase in queuosine biosynthesis
MTIKLPELTSGKKVALFLSGGINSTMLAVLCVEKYGKENVVPLLNCFKFTLDTKNERLMNNRIASFNKIADKLQLENRVILNKYEDYNVGIHNLITDRHRLNFIDAFIEIMNKRAYDIDFIIIGSEKLDLEIKTLIELDSHDGIINTIDSLSINEYVKQNTKLFPEVIKHGVLDGDIADWIESNLFYNKDHRQYDYVNETTISKPEYRGHFPFFKTTKKQIVKMYYDRGLEDLLEMTTSCHRGINYPKPCNTCKNCLQRKIALS